jgi:DNA-binding response OmpR family regulator
MASTPAAAEHDARSEQRALSMLLYSDDSDVREAVRLAVGRRPAPDLPQVRWTEVATEAAVLSAVDAGGLDVLVLDGEAVPSGGMGLCKQLKDEIYRCPPVLVLIGRQADAWLATWSRADLVVPHPLDPVAVADAVAQLARRRLRSRPR